MPNESKSKDLKLIHLFWTIIIFVATAGVAWGIMRNEVSNQKINITKIENHKVSKEVFSMHITTQTQQFETLTDSIDRGFNRMDKRLENIEKK